MDFEVYHNYPPGDPVLVDKIVCQLKSQGIFDHFRKECFSDVDTKPAYQNLRQRVDGSVAGFLANHKWKPDLNKNQLRESLRKHVINGGFLEVGVERIVDQVVNPKIGHVFLPQVKDLVFECLGIKQPKLKEDVFPFKSNRPLQSFPSTSMVSSGSHFFRDNSSNISTDTLFKGSSYFSAEMDFKIKSEYGIDEHSKTGDSDSTLSRLKAVDNTVDSYEDGMSRPFESHIVGQSDNSLDSHISGISDLTSVNLSGDSNMSDDNKDKSLDEFAKKQDVSNESIPKAPQLIDSMCENSLMDFNSVSEFKTYEHEKVTKIEKVDQPLISSGSGTDVDTSEKHEFNFKSSVPYHHVKCERKMSELFSEDSKNSVGDFTSLNDDSDSCDKQIFEYVAKQVNDNSNKHDDMKMLYDGENSQEEMEVQLDITNQITDSTNVDLQSENDAEKIDTASRESTEFKFNREHACQNKSSDGRCSGDEDKAQKCSEEDKGNNHRSETQQEKNRSTYQKRDHHSKEHHSREHHSRGSSRESRDSYSRKDDKSRPKSSEISKDKHKSSRSNMEKYYKSEEREKESKKSELSDMKPKDSRSRDHEKPKSDSKSRRSDSDSKAKPHSSSQGETRDYKDKHKDGNNDGTKEESKDLERISLKDRSRDEGKDRGSSDHRDHRHTSRTNRKDESQDHYKDSKSKRDESKSKDRHYQHGQDDYKSSRSHGEHKRDHGRSSHRSSEKDRRSSKREYEKHSKDKGKSDDKEDDRNKKDKESKNKKSREQCKSGDQYKEDRHSADGDSSGAGESRNMSNSGSSKESKSREGQKDKETHSSSNKSSSDGSASDVALCCNIEDSTTSNLSEQTKVEESAVTSIVEEVLSSLEQKHILGDLVSSNDNFEESINIKESSSHIEQIESSDFLKSSNDDLAKSRFLEESSSHLEQMDSSDFQMISFKDTTEQIPQDEHSTEDVRKLFKFRKQKIAKNIFEVRKIIRARKNMQRMERNRLKNLNSSGLCDISNNSVRYFKQSDLEHSRKKIDSFKLYLNTIEHNYNLLKRIEKDSLITSEFILDTKFDLYLENECGFQVLRKECIRLPELNNDNYYFDEKNSCYILNKKTTLDDFDESCVDNTSEVKIDDPHTVSVSETNQIDRNCGKCDNKLPQLVLTDSCVQEQKRSPVKLRINVRNPNNCSVIETEEILLYNPSETGTSIRQSEENIDSLEKVELTEKVVEDNSLPLKESNPAHTLPIKQSNDDDDDDDDKEEEEEEEEEEDEDDGEENTDALHNNNIGENNANENENSLPKQDRSSKSFNRKRGRPKKVKRGRPKKVKRARSKNRNISSQNISVIGKTLDNTDKLQNKDFHTDNSFPKDENYHSTSLKITLSRRNMPEHMAQIVSPKSPSNANCFSPGSVICSDSAAVPSESDSAFVIAKSHSSNTESKLGGETSCTSSKYSSRVNAAEYQHVDIISPMKQNCSLSELSDSADEGQAHDGDNKLASQLIGDALKDLMHESGLTAKLDETVSNCPDSDQQDTRGGHSGSQRVASSAKVNNEQPKNLRVSERLSAGSKQSQRYDSSDLYKPRFDFGQSTRRKRKAEVSSESISDRSKTKASDSSYSGPHRKRRR